MEMNSVFDGHISRLNMAEDRISELENIPIESSKTEKQRNKDWKKENKTEYGLWDNHKRHNTHVMGIQEEEEREKRREKIFETVMTENFL